VVRLRFAFFTQSPPRHTNKARRFALTDETFSMTTAEISVVTPTPDEIHYLEDRIYEFNSAKTGITNGEWLAIFARDETGRIVAGISGDTWGGCLEIRQL
jgi:hypothetical protein